MKDEVLVLRVQNPNASPCDNIQGESEGKQHPSSEYLRKLQAWVNNWDKLDENYSSQKRFY